MKAVFHWLTPLVLGVEQGSKLVADTVLKQGPHAHMQTYIDRQEYAKNLPDTGKEIKTEVELTWIEIDRKD